MTLRRRKSRKQQAADLLGSYLKLKGAGKAAKGAGKAVKSTPKAAVAGIPLIIGAAIAAFVVAKVLRGGDEEQPASA